MKYKLLMAFALLGVLLVSGCDKRPSECEDGTVCILKEEHRLLVIELYNCHVEICSKYNLEPYISKLDECSCKQNLYFIDEGHGMFYTPIDKTRVVKCWNPEELVTVTQLSFTNVWDECKS